MTKLPMLRSGVRFLALGCVVIPPSSATAAMSGPPVGRVDDTVRQERSPTSTAPSPGDTESSAPSTESQSQERRPPRRLPIYQRYDERIEATEIAAPSQPNSGDHGLMYVPGFRQILSGHNENYFISGVGSTQHVVKFQYSVKFDLWPNASRHSAYFAFTQKSLWKLWDFSGSSPFVESNYAPELFYGYYTKVGDVVPVPGRVTYFIDYARAGLEHESNGLAGATSRGWNRVYASMRVGAYVGVDNYVSLTPKAWLPPFAKDDNPDITSYLGYGSLGVEYGYDPARKRWWGGFSVGATAWKGANAQLDRGALEIAGQWRPGYAGNFVQWWKFTPYFYAQVYDGYGESLLQYNQRVNVFRVGLALEDRVNWITLPKSRAVVAP